MAPKASATRGSEAPWSPALSLICLVLSAWAVCALALLSDLTHRWGRSGSALESLLLLFGPALQSDVPSWALVLGLNAVYAVAATSWLLRLVFASICWPLVVATSIAQYAAISSFTRGRLRWLLKHLHFYRDKVAFFSFPVLIIDAEIAGFVAVHGVTASLLTLSIEFHSIDFSLNIGQGHEIHVHTDSLEIKLFRRITIGEIYAAHKCLEDGEEPSFDVDAADGSGRRDSKPCGPDESHIVTDNKLHEASARRKQKDPSYRKPINPSRTNTPAKIVSLGDDDAEAKYGETLKTLHARGGLYQMRERLRHKTHGSGEYSESELVEIRALLCAELRRTGLSPLPDAEKITTSKLATLFPEPNVFEYVPSAMRMLLWLASHTHPIDCPSISVAGSGHWLKELLFQVLFRRHSTDDERIRSLEQEISEWLSNSEYCVDLAKITALGQVPFRSMYNIKAETRSTSIAVSRIDTSVESSTQIASVSGFDSTFTIPMCLLPNHSHLVPPEPSLEKVAEAERQKREEIEKKQLSEEPKPIRRSTSMRTNEEQEPTIPEEEEKPVDIDTLGILMSIRVTLPARFHDSFLSLATSVSKAAQMIDIDDQFIDPPTPPAMEDISDPANNWRDKFVKRSTFIGSAIKHPLVSARGNFHREVRKSTVMKVNGAWVAKWTGKIMEQLEWLNGDLGYTFELPVSLKPYR